MEFMFSTKNFSPFFFKKKEKKEEFNLRVETYWELSKSNHEHDSVYNKLKTRNVVLIKRSLY